MTITTTLSEAEVKALNTEIADIEEYVSNFIHERARVIMERIASQEMLRMAEEMLRMAAAGIPINMTIEEIVLAAELPNQGENPAVTEDNAIGGV